MTKRPNIDLRPSHNRHLKEGERVIGIDSESGNCLISTIDTGTYLLLMIHGLSPKVVVRIGQVPRDAHGQRTST